MVIQYLEQPDPPENAPEDPTQIETSGDADSASSGAATHFDSGENGFFDEDAESEYPDSDDDVDFDDDDIDFDDDVDFDDDDDDDDFDDDDDDEPSEASSLPADAWTLARLRAAVSPNSLQGKSPDEQRTLRRDAWRALLAAPHPPPRLRIGDILISLYQEGSDWARASLIEIFREARIGWGMWRGLKHIYKEVEAGHDAELFGILAWRLDAAHRTPLKRGEVSGATLGYLRRRAWRYLRQLGQAVPELYPQFASQVLRHYPAGFWFAGCWVANQIWAHHDLIGARSAWQRQPPKKLERRAFDEAWKLSPAPLLRLLEDAANDDVCDFAIRSLRADFPDTLRQAEPAWLARIGTKPLASVHEFVVEIIEGNPALHRSDLAALGLHDMVLGLLRSESNKAAAYAVEYAKAHAPDIPITTLIEIAEVGGKQACELARARLAAQTPRALGLTVLVRMLAVGALEKLASEKLEAGFKPGDLSAELYVALAMGTNAQQRFVASFYKKHKQKVPAAFLRAHAEAPGLSSWQRRRVLQELGKCKGADIGIDWIKDALLDRRFSDAVSGWLRAGMLAGEHLDVDWLKGLVMRPRLRPLALELLGNPKLVAPHRIGVPWLLAMARQADDSVSGFAHRYLLEHVAPDDFALDAGATEVEAGIERIWALVQPGQPEPVRRFAATYLRVHHPEIGPGTEEAKSLGIKPRLPRAAYTLARVRPLFDDAGADIRRVARDLGRQELVRWDHPRLVYELARSRFREGRLLAAEALLHIGDSDADPKLVPPIEWLSPGEVFTLAESPVKATREVALTLVRRHYGLLGGAARLGWLMESPDREVRLFAVRLLWDRHRPLPHAGAAGPEAAGHGAEAHTRFDSTEALRQFVRTVLFGLPPGRMERREGSGDALPERPLPASEAKRRLVEVVRDMAVEDAAFADVVVPVLEEFMASQAKGEWHACVAALARIRHAHPDIQTALPAAVVAAPESRPREPSRG
ncbi:hypothetical protein [Haliangium sp.]|uniref:hypothetical protein n=1 Tax=Haliangium sp. TaxID=2663208 RepID=UPI003D101B9D